MQNGERFFLRVKNFKCLKDVEIEIKPITLFFGANGSGKSSFIKAIRFLSHNLFSIWDELHEGGPDSEKFYYKTEDGLDLISFAEIVADNDTSKKIVFEIRMENALIGMDELLKYYDVKKDGLQDNPIYSIISKKNKFEIVKDQEKENKFWDALESIDWTKKDNTLKNVFIDFKVTVEFSYRPKRNLTDLKITITDQTNDFKYTFTPNTASEENYYSYYKKIELSGDKEKEHFLNSLFELENAMPFIDCLEQNYYIRDERRKKFLKKYKEEVLRYLYNHQKEKFWSQLTFKEQQELYFYILKEFVIIFILIPEKIESYFRQVIHLSSIRETPKLLYPIIEGRFDSSAYYGLLREFDRDDNQIGIPVKAQYDEFSDSINIESEIDKIPVGSISKFINYFIRKLELADWIDVHKEKFSGFLVFKTFKKKAISNLSLASSGLLQVLPIISASFYIRRKDHAYYKFIRIIEQPELHLHPKLQSNLAEFFCHKVLKDRNFIIETHSEHLIRKIQVLIAKSNKEMGHENLKERVVVYYFDKGTIKEMELEDNGFFKEPWPDGFFDDSYNLARELIYARKN